MTKVCVKFIVLLHCYLKLSDGVARDGGHERYLRPIVGTGCQVKLSKYISLGT